MAGESPAVALPKVTAAMVDHAIDRSDFCVMVQPRVRACDYIRIGGEALCRLPGLQQQFALDEIMNVCSGQPTINRVTYQVMDALMADLASYCDVLGAGASLSINLCPYSLHDDCFVQKFLPFLDQMAASGIRLELELPGRYLGAVPDNVIHNARLLAGRGVRLLIDEFGASRTSMDLLHHDFFAGIKIARGLVTRMTSDARDDNFVMWMIDTAHHLGMTVSAVGVEREIIASRLRDYGVDELQGFFFGQAEPIGDLRRRVANRLQA